MDPRLNNRRSYYGEYPKPMETPPPRRKKRLACIIATAITVVLLALALGLGIGLALRNRGSDDDDSDDIAPPRETKWKPQVGDSWQIILRQPLDLSEELTPDVEVYDLDLFTNERSVFAELQRRGKKVICYFSAGSYEDFRPDSKEFDEGDLGMELDGWPGERWLNMSSSKVRSIMADRIELAAKKGCDAIDPDNVDGYNNENGLGLTEQDSISMMNFLSAEASKYKLAVGLKNAGQIIPDVLDRVDFSVNEQCAQYEECDVFAQFIAAGKPVFQIEYPDGGAADLDEKQAKERCEAEGMEEFSTVLKDMVLDGWVQYCDGDSYETAIDTQ